MNLNTLDTQPFDNLLEPYRRELRAHCYRMTGSTHDAEDLVQETFLRAWRSRSSFEGRASLRAWLYKIATNACLDHLRKAARRTVPRLRESVSTAGEPYAKPILEPIWLQPYPDEWLIADHDNNPDARLSEREDVTLAFTAALQLLPPRQRAILLLRDVLDWQASEVATLLDTTESAVKSALHRARSTLSSQREMLTASDSADELDESTRQLLDDYVHAWENADVDALLDLLREDATFSMPPIPSWYRGRSAIRNLLNTIFSDMGRGRWRLLPTGANRQPAFGVYKLMDDDGCFHAYGIQVLAVQAGIVADIVTFKDSDLLAHFNLPVTLPVSLTKKRL